MKERIGKLCVGLASAADPPDNEAAVREILVAHVQSNTLPFVGVVTSDLEWVAGFGGYKQTADFVKFLDEVEASPALSAKPDVAKKLDALATQAAAAAEKEKWLEVLKAGRAAAELKGRNPAREKIAASVAKARAWADAEMNKALDAGKPGGDRAAARAALKKVQSAMSGEPEAKEAEAGVRAIDRLGILDGVGADKVDAAREKATKDFAGTRWVALFAKAETEKKDEEPEQDEEPAK